MAEYSRMASGSFVSTASLSQTIYLPFVPDQVEVWDLSGTNHPANTSTAYMIWNQYMFQGDGTGWRNSVFGTTPPVTCLSSVNYNPGGVSTFSTGPGLQFGAQQQVASVTKANPAVVTTAASHGYNNGDVVLFEGLPGMLQIAGMPFAVTVTGATTFTIPWNTNQSNYTAVASSPVGAYVKKALYPFMYAPGKSVISSLTLGASTTVVTTAPHNLVVGQEVAFRISAPWGTTQLNSLPNIFVPGSPIYGYVISVTNSTTVVVSINSSAFTAFNTNIALTAVAGLTSPQMIAMGDVNNGGLPYSGGALYPSPVVNGVSTINGPAIQGAFVNNTRQGFIIGSSFLTGGGLSIYWEASLHDYSQGSMYSQVTP